MLRTRAKVWPDPLGLRLSLLHLRSRIPPQFLHERLVPLLPHIELPANLGELVQRSERQLPIPNDLFDERGVFVGERFDGEVVSRQGAGHGGAS